MESVPCAAFRGSVVNIVSGTSLTVTHETDADTVADYPTFVWLHRPDRSYFSFLCLCGGWHQFFLASDDLWWKCDLRSQLCNGLSPSLWLQEHLILSILCVGHFPPIFRQYTYILAAACVTVDGSLQLSILEKLIFYLLVHHVTSILLAVLSHVILKWLFFSGLLR